MTEGNLELVEILVNWVVLGPAAAAIVLRDERRLRPDQRARAWPPVSRDAAIFLMYLLGFTEVCVLAFFVVHFVRTRGVAAGLARALPWAFAVVALGTSARFGIDSLFRSAG